MPVIMQIIDGASGGRYDVHIGCIGGQHQDRCGQRRPAFEPGPAQEQPGCRVCQGVHRVGVTIVRKKGPGKAPGSTKAG